MKKKKYLSFIIVKDENKAPFNLKISYKGLYFLMTVIFTFFLSIGLAMVYYYSFYNQYSNYNEILAENLLLKEERSKVTKIFVEFQKIREIDKRLRNLLGDEVSGQEGTEITEVSMNDITYDNNASNISALYRELNVIKIDNVNNIPSLLPVDGYITREFEMISQMNMYGHPGIDLVAKEGSIIRATADGVVIFSGWSYKYGNMVIIDHQNGFISYYKHNKSVMVEEGGIIKRSDSIALLGNSGLSSGPHLHFEIWKDGVPLDPTILVGQ
jgi:murein DD-endopeptidase MepM/ murein hydrolase activator NlpD